MIEAYQDHVVARAFKMYSRCRLCSKVTIPWWSQEWWRSLPVLPRVTYVCFFVFQFTEFHSTVLWATFYFFMILHLLEALCLVTEGWLSCQLQWRTFWFAAMARRTQQVTFDFPHSKQILLSLTWHRRYLGENFGGRGFKPRKHVCCKSPQPRALFHGNQGLRMERL